MATYFTRTDTFNGVTVEADSPRVYTVFTADAGFRGWVSGGSRSFRFFPDGGSEWGPSATTRQKAVDAYYADRAEKDAAQRWRSQQAPTAMYAVRLTSDNLADEADQLVGCWICGAEDLGRIEFVRLTHDGRNNAMVVGAHGRDVVGLPSQVIAYQL